MPQALEQNQVLAPVREAELPPLAPSKTAERRARADLRAQIARLEAELAELFASSFPRHGIDWRIGAVGGPRVLDTGELERVRDALAARLRETRTELARRADAEEEKRLLIESMIAAPEEHRWMIVSNEDIGEAGCRHWHSRPRWGLLGMLRGWWRVRVSSGCPLAAGLAAPSHPRSAETLSLSAQHVSSASKKKRRKRRPRAAAPAMPQAEAEAEAPPKPKPRSRRREPEARPPAPWGSFPLAEVVILIGIVMLIAGVIVGTDAARGQALLGTGVALAALAGLELSIREHFAGFRSHTALLASAAAVATMLGLFYLADLDTTPSLVGGAVAGLAAGFLLVRAFRARSGGRSVKLR